MAETNTQTLSSSLNLRARLAKIATPTRQAYEAAKRRAKSAERFARLRGRLAEIKKERADAAQEKRADAAFAIGSAVRAVREERTSRAISAAIMGGIALCVFAQTILAVSSI